MPIFTRIAMKTGPIIYQIMYLLIVITIMLAGILMLLTAINMVMERGKMIICGCPA